MLESHRRQQKEHLFSRRRGIEFQPIDGYSSDSSDEDTDAVRQLRRTRQCATDHPDSSCTTICTSTRAIGDNDIKTTTDLDADSEMKKVTDLRGQFGQRNDTQPDYSHIEEDITAVSSSSKSRDKAGWQPGFKRRYTSVEKGKWKAKGPDHSYPPPGAVAMTPCLIHALDRIAIAPKAAYCGAEVQSSSPWNKPEGLPAEELDNLEEPEYHWDSFCCKGVRF